MRFFQLLAAAALSLTAVVAKKSPSAFDVYYKKQSPVTLTEQAYDEITSAPRDYYAAVILTALDVKYACGICREFQPEWDIIARSWRKGDKKGEHRLLFGTLDFDQGKNVFVKVRAPRPARDFANSSSTNCKLLQSCSSFLQLQAPMPRRMDSLFVSTSLVLRLQKVSTAGSNGICHPPTTRSYHGPSTGRG